MKELTSAFQSEVFRPVVTLVVPGSFAVSTISIACWQRAPRIQQFANDFPGFSGVILLLVVLACGLTAEDLGSGIERHFDSLLRRTAGHEKHLDEWLAYLRLAFDKEPIGQRYLRSVVLRLKFELGMAIASAPFAIGSWWTVNCIAWRVSLLLASALVFVYFWHEAKISHRVLGEVRHELLKKESA